MIKAKPKDNEQIMHAIRSYTKILTVGCGGCVSVCLAGGQKEVMALNAELQLLARTQNIEKTFAAYTVERQCNERFLYELDERIAGFDGVLSMACGAGVQLLAERYPDKPIFPAVDTHAIGIDRGIGLYEECCRACGECVIGYTGGICPVTRCAKSLFNGPCGGVDEDRCEANSDAYCAWVEIYHRLKRQNRLDDILHIQQAREWQNQVQRTVVQKNYEKRYYQR